MTNAKPKPETTTMICYELSKKRVLDMLKFEGGQRGQTLVGFYFEFKDSSTEPARPRDAILVVPVYREGNKERIIRHEGSARKLKELGRVFRRSGAAGGADEPQDATQPHLYRKLQGYDEVEQEIEFVFFGTEEMRYLATRSKTLRFSGCHINPMEVWDPHWDDRPTETPNGPLFTLKVEGLRSKDKKIVIKDGLSAAFFAGAPCPTKWYTQPS